MKGEDLRHRQHHHRHHHQHHPSIPTVSTEPSVPRVSESAHRAPKSAPMQNVPERPRVSQNVARVCQSVPRGSQSGPKHLTASQKPLKVSLECSQSVPSAFQSVFRASPKRPCVTRMPPECFKSLPVSPERPKSVFVCLQVPRASPEHPQSVPGISLLRGHVEAMLGSVWGHFWTPKNFS